MHTWLNLYTDSTVNHFSISGFGERIKVFRPGKHTDINTQ